MKTKIDIIKKNDELTTVIKEAREVECSESQKLALDFAQKIVSTSQVIDLLIESNAPIEAHTICRLMFEHLFNFGGLLYNEIHYNLLHEHSNGEVSRQLKKIYQKNEENKTLTAENSKLVNEYMSHPDRKNDPKTGMNWEQIAKYGHTDSLYGTYTQYSFLYAHSTLASLVKPVSEMDIGKLRENVWTVLEMVRLMIRVKILQGAEKNGK